MPGPNGKSSSYNRRKMKQRNEPMLKPLLSQQRPIQLRLGQCRTPNESCPQLASRPLNHSEPSPPLQPSCGEGLGTVGSSIFSSNMRVYTASFPALCARFNSSCPMKTHGCQLTQPRVDAESVEQPSKNSETHINSLASGRQLGLLLDTSPRRIDRLRVDNVNSFIVHCLACLRA